MLHAVIMAGGSGTRFWPASRSKFPKQFLNMGGKRTLLQSTVDRISTLIPPDRTRVVTNQSLVPLVREQLPTLPPEGVLGEPCKRDTAPCVALAAALTLRQDPNAIQVVMPSDHVIQTEADFQMGIRFAEAMVREQPDCIVTFGIRPSYPATAFGYIERDPQQPIEPTDSGNFGSAVMACKVKQFREKPTLEVAEEFLKSGQFLWNAGIFVWRADTVLAAIRKFAPEIMGPIDEIAAAADTPEFLDVFADQFPRITGRSIDYAVMEHYPTIAVVEAPFAWDDVGNWNSLARLVPADSHGNHVVGQHLALDSEDCVIQSADPHLIVTAGVSNLIIVHTPDATLIADRNQEELIRQIVPSLQSSRPDLT